MPMDATNEHTGVTLRVLIVYDCLYPWNVGGAERWYRALAEQLAAAGHQVTYLTLRQWPAAEPAAPAGAQERDGPPAIPGVTVRTAGPRLALYQGARRRLWPPLRFGLGVGWHLLRHGRRYDVVHAASFPYWPLLAAAAWQRRGGYRLLIDWWEVWTRAYWRSYAGWVVGTAGWLVQRRCLRLPQHAFVFSRLHAARLRAEGYRGPLTKLRGVYAGPLPGSEPAGAPPVAAPALPSAADPFGRRPLAAASHDSHAASASGAPALPPGSGADAVPDGPFILYAGRHIPEKRVPAIVPALARCRETLPELTAVITGDGLTRRELEIAIRAAKLETAVRLPGFVPELTLDELYRAALCVVLPSRREGFGLIVVEAAARGTPSVVVAGPDNAATELIEPGVNGFIAGTATAPALASAILAVYRAGPALRASTLTWFTANASRLTLAGSLAQVSAAYRAGRSAKDQAPSCPPPSSPA